MADKKTYYTIYWFGFGPCDNVRYPTREAAQAKIDSIPPNPNIALGWDDEKDEAGTPYTIEEWTPENTFQEKGENDEEVRVGCDPEAQFTRVRLARYEEVWVKCDTEAQFTKFTRLAHYDTPEKFKQVTDVGFDEVKGKWFQVVRDRVRFQDDEKSAQTEH